MYDLMGYFALTVYCAHDPHEACIASRDRTGTTFCTCPCHVAVAYNRARERALTTPAGVL